MIKLGDGRYKNLKILILCGGICSEPEPSLMSAKSVYDSMIKMGYSDLHIINLTNNIHEDILRIKPDVVFNSLHGRYGEDGTIQGLLEFLNIPYTHSNVETSALGMNKIFTKYIARNNNIPTPESLEMNSVEYLNMIHSTTQPKHPMKKPYVIKPISEGSSLGVYIVENDDDIKAIPKEKDWIYGDKIMVEEFISGQELSCAIIRNKAQGILELKPSTRFYDYYAKYTDGITEHIMPANIPQNIYELVMQYSEKIHRILGCTTLSRSDFIYDKSKENDSGIYFIEINTHPGFTQLSILPEIAAHNGILFNEIIEMLIEDAKCHLKKINN